MHGQIIENSYDLKYGESTYVPVEDLDAQEEELETEVVKEKNNKVNIDMKQMLTIFSIMFGVIIIIGLIFTIKSKFTKSGLDKEIAEIKEDTSDNEKIEEKDDEIDKTYI